MSITSMSREDLFNEILSEIQYEMSQFMRADLGRTFDLKNNQAYSKPDEFVISLQEKGLNINIEMIEKLKDWAVAELEHSRITKLVKQLSSLPIPK